MNCFYTKKNRLLLLFALLFVVFSSFELHKFYMAIFQINFVTEKKMVQITSRIFVDDLEKALEKADHKKMVLSLEKIAPEDLVLLKKYFSENFSLTINGQAKPMTFLSSELDDDVLICYFNIKAIAAINSLEIYNTILTGWNADQQNLTHIVANGTKNSVLFTASSKKEMLKYR